MPPEPAPLRELLLAFEVAERCASNDDIAGAYEALQQFDLVLRRTSADDLAEDAARTLHSRVGALRDRLLAAKDRALNELLVSRRTREYGSEDPATGRWIEDRA